jgi:hypothetical protein
MTGEVEVLSEQYGCWGERTWLYHLRYEGRRYRVSIVSLLDRDSHGATDCYWADISEWQEITDDVALVRPMRPTIGIPCDSRDEAYAAAIRVITGATDNADTVVTEQPVARRSDAADPVHADWPAS